MDPDVEQMLREAMRRNRSSFKKEINEAIRAGLSGQIAPQKPFKVKARPMGLRAGINPADLNKLADELEVEAFLERSAMLLSRA